MPASAKIWSCLRSAFCCPFPDQPGTDGGQQHILESDTRCTTSAAEGTQVDYRLCYRLDPPSRNPSAKWNLAYEKPIQAIEEELNWSLKRNKELSSRIHELEDFMCSKSVFSSDKMLEQSLKEKRQLEGRAQQAEQSIRDLKHEMAVLQKRLQQAENPFPGSWTPPLPSPLPPPAVSKWSHDSVSLWNALQIPGEHGDEDNFTTANGGSFHMKQYAMTEILQIIRNGVPLKSVTPCKKINLSSRGTDPVSPLDMREYIQEGDQEMQEGAKNTQPDAALKSSCCPSPPDQGQTQGDAVPEESREHEFLDHKSPNLREVGSSESNTDNVQGRPTVMYDPEDKKACSTSVHSSERAPMAMEELDNCQMPYSEAVFLGSSNRVAQRSF
uniref:Shootin-1-like n=1 Tax=Geotrypetes seraphini TaxID=260995 RepID=A0A6P8RJ07_GEOSA|nr:shootin-1-like [Geotrypetes seraphini]